MLYFDKRLSSDGTISCSTCHSIPRAFTDRRRFSEGIHGHLGNRHSPTIINAAYQQHYFWDGRAKTLEEQCMGPIGNPKEMTTAANSHDAYEQCQERICEIVGYRTLFKDAFGDEKCSIDNIAKAIATFERTVISGNSPFDKYMAGDRSAMTKQQIDGFAVFKHAGCANCHFGPNFSDGRFINIGIGMDAEQPDLGRYDVTHDDKDKGAFKVPTLRDVSKTYPYMHDGSISSLEDVVDYYDKGGLKNPYLHPLIKPLGLSSDDKKALVAFLYALDGEGWQHFKEPASLPQ